MYKESFFFFFFFFFSIDHKKITVQEADTDLTEKQKFNDDKKINTAAAINEV